MHQHATLEDTVYFWFGANDTGGSGDDGAAPLYDVRLGGAAAGAAPVLSGNGTLLTHANYPDGCHEVEIAATAANGFAAGNTYGVFCTLLVDGENPTGFVGSFTLGPIVSDVTHIHGTALTEGPGNLAGRFSDFFDQAAVEFSVATPLVQEIAQFMYRTTDTVSLLEAGVDNARTAIEAANAGDVVILGPGTFALGANGIQVPAGVIVKGAGKNTTILTSTLGSIANGCIYKLGTNSLSEDFTVRGLNAGGAIQYAVGCSETAGDTPFTNAVLRDVGIYANYDGLYMASVTGCTVLAVDCTIESGCDSVVILSGASCQMDLVNCQIGIDDIQGGICRTLAADAGLIRAWNCDAHAVGTGTETMSGASCGGTGIVELYGGCYRASGGATNYDLRRTAGTLVACGCQYDRSKTDGTITEVSGLHSAIGAGPTANSPLQIVGDWLNGGRLDNILDAVVPGATIELTTEGENLITP